MRSCRFDLLGKSDRADVVCTADQCAATRAPRVQSAGTQEARREASISSSTALLGQGRRAWKSLGTDTRNKQQQTKKGPLSRAAHLGRGRITNTRLCTAASRHFVSRATFYSCKLVKARCLAKKPLPRGTLESRPDAGIVSRAAHLCEGHLTKEPLQTLRKQD